MAAAGSPTSSASPTCTRMRGRSGSPTARTKCTATPSPSSRLPSRPRSPRLSRAASTDMDLKGKVAVITGAASGIGRAAALRFAQEGAAGLVLADLNLARLEPVAQEVKGLAVACDVGREADIKRLVREAEEKHGRIDVYFSNAGIVQRGGLEARDADWDRNWRIHVMAHVGAARAVVEKLVA